MTIEPSLCPAITSAYCCIIGLVSTLTPAEHLRRPNPAPCAVARKQPEASSRRCPDHRGTARRIAPDSLQREFSADSRCKDPLAHQREPLRDAWPNAVNCMEFRSNEPSGSTRVSSRRGSSSRESTKNPCARLIACGHRRSLIGRLSGSSIAPARASVRCLIVSFPAPRASKSEAPLILRILRAY